MVVLNDQSWDKALNLTVTGAEKALILFVV